MNQSANQSIGYALLRSRYKRDVFHIQFSPKDVLGKKGHRAQVDENGAGRMLVHGLKFEHELYASQHSVLPTLTSRPASVRHGGPEFQANIDSCIERNSKRPHEMLEGTHMKTPSGT